MQTVIVKIAPSRTPIISKELAKLQIQRAIANVKRGIIKF